MLIFSEYGEKGNGDDEDTSEEEEYEAGNAAESVNSNWWCEEYRMIQPLHTPTNNDKMPWTMDDSHRNVDFKNLRNRMSKWDVML